jgi:1-hydroxycarotenoid 3,4-desaturase
MAHVVIVGAGMGGLAAALDLRIAGNDVTVLERAAAPGGKASSVEVGGVVVDAGPTVLTMRWVFDELFARAGRSLDDYVALEPAPIIARHAWADGTRLDLHADVEENVDAIGRFAGAAEARNYRAFAARGKAAFEASRDTFLTAERPTLASLVTSGPIDLRALVALDPARSMWRALAASFRDARLRQLFGRYATYCGASPFEAAATLNVIAHVETLGVWRVRGGISALAAAMARRASELGVELRYGAEVGEIVGERRAEGVRLRSGEDVRADAVLVNADVAALAGGAFGARVSRSVSSSEPRSFSALTWAVIGRAHGLEAAHHTVFFSDDYRAEFDDLVKRRRAPAAPSIYVCAQDRDERPPPPRHEERFLVVMNAPATGDEPVRWSEEERRRCERAAFETMRRSGWTLEPTASVMTTPVEFAARFPSTGGALYGPRPRGSLAAFRREGATTKMPGLYLAGGSVHPGPGVPMAVTSGALAARRIAEDLRSIGRSRAAGTSGTTSTA